MLRLGLLLLAVVAASVLRVPAAFSIAGIGPTAVSAGVASVVGRGAPGGGGLAGLHGVWMGSLVALLLVDPRTRPVQPDALGLQHLLLFSLLFDQRVVVLFVVVRHSVSEEMEARRTHEACTSSRPLHR